MSKTKCDCINPQWVVIHYKHNHSAFEAPKYLAHPSQYSTVMCQNCGYAWRTKAKYVERLPIME